jgi:hypothetical protein
VSLSQTLSPHAAHTRADIDAGSLAGGTRRADESGSRGVHVTIALSVLTVREEPLRDREVEVVVCTENPIWVDDVVESPKLAE